MSEISVPDNHEFTLDDVVDAVQPSESTLDKCFDESVDAYFNDDYKGDKDRLSNFRDYGFTPVECDGDVEHDGGEDYPSTDTITLGTDEGTVELEFDAYNIPDLFLVHWDGEIVIDTGYRGGFTYEYGGADRSNFTSALNGKVDPISGDTFPVDTDYDHIEPDGYPIVTSGGSGTATFEKNKQYPTNATVEVYAPQEHTAWKFTLGCPESS